MLLPRPARVEVLAFILALSPVLAFCGFASTTVAAAARRPVAHLRAVAAAAATPVTPHSAAGAAGTRTVAHRPAAGARAARPPVRRLAPDVARALRSRAREWLRISGSSRTAGIPLDVIVQNLESLADTLEAAGLDSLSSSSLTNAGYLARRMGDGRRAERDWNRAIATGRRAGDESDVVAAQMLLADYTSTRHFDESVRIMEHAATYYARVHADSDRCDVLERIAVLYKAAGRYEDALRRARVLETAARAAGYEAQHAEALVIQSMCLALESREIEALQAADSAMAVQPLCGRNKQSILARVQTARAVALRALGRDPEAMDATLEAIRITAELHDRHHLRSLAYMKGLIDFDLGRYEDVLRDMEEPMAGAAADGDEWPELTYRIMHAAALVALQRYAPAESALKVLVPRVDGFRHRQKDEETQAGFFTQTGELYATQARLYMETGRAGEAWFSVERGRAQTLKDRLTDNAGQPSLDTLQTMLGAGHAALIQMSEPLYNPVVAFVVTGDNVQTRVMGPPLRASEAATIEGLLSSGASEGDCNPALKRLADRVLSGIPEMIPRDVERLYIVAPTAMAGMAFEALPIPGDTVTERLGDRWAVSYLPCAQVLGQLQHDRPAGAGMLVMADPFVQTGRQSFNVPVVFRGLVNVPLPAARQEAREVAAPGAAVLTGRNATRQRLFSSDTSHRAVLHFATHAVQNTMDPDSSGILLAGPDGLMNSSDVERLRLEADLVTLSGCQTAGGRMFRGEGVFGLSRSFLIAGARSVVTSLWDVEDRAAARFMKLFYDGLKDGLPRDESLKRARVRMREDGYAPRDWAAFVLTGVGQEPVSSLSGGRIAGQSRNNRGH